MSVEELQVVAHGSREVVLVGVDLLQTGDDGVKPASGLHALVVERCLQEAGAPSHLVEGLLVELRSRSEILVVLRDHILIRCHLRSHLRQKQLHPSARSAAGSPRKQCRSR